MPTKQRTPAWPAVAAIAGVLAIAGVVTLALLLTGSDPQPKPKPVPPPQPAALTQSGITKLLHDYEAAYSAEDVDALEALFAPGFRRTNDGDPPESRDAALDTYASQFADLDSPTYELHDVKVTITGTAARAEGSYDITSAAGPVGGSISVDIAAVDGSPLITAIVTDPDAGSTPSPRPEPEPQPKPKPGGSGSYASTCSIKAWYSGPPLTVNTFIHFKCVDEDSGETVAEAEGSDEIDLDKEADAAKRNTAREELVDQLGQKLQDDGWTEIGSVDGGDWYQLRFGR